MFCVLTLSVQVLTVCNVRFDLQNVYILLSENIYVFLYGSHNKGLLVSYMAMGDNFL
jgi:hypothetical protein